MCCLLTYLYEVNVALAIITQDRVQMIFQKWLFHLKVISLVYEHLFFT